MALSLKGKRALVTGASSGIGRAIAAALADAGCRLVITARRAQVLEGFAREIEERGGRASVAAADLSHLDQVDSLVQRAREDLGGIDILVNNAGSGIQGFFWKSSVDEGERLINLNLLAPLRLMKALLPEMVRRDEGCVVNMASVSAMLALPTGAHYSASKAALASVSEAVGLELILNRSRVRILLVCPGPVYTDILKIVNKDPMAARFYSFLPHGDAETLARLTVRAIEKGDRLVVYPRVYNALRFMPGILKQGLSFLCRFPRQAMKVSSGVDRLRR